jgi:signal transduction histidine kinase
MRLSTDPDAVAVRVAARVRVGVAVVVAAAGSFLPDVTGRRATLFLVLGLVWLPWACVVLFAADGLRSRVALVGGPAGDLLALFAFHALEETSGTAPFVGYVAIVAFAAYTGGRTIGVLLGGLAMALSLVAGDIAASSAGGRDGVEPAAVVLLGAALAAVVVLLDRTAILQRRSEAHREHIQVKSDVILSRVADAVIVSAADGRVLQLNAAAERLLGRPECDAVGVACGELLGLHAGERTFDCSKGCALLEWGRTGDADLGVEVWRLDANARRQPLLASVATVGTADVEVVHSLRDITKLKQADEAKTLFLATASHELKTPLTVINGFAETMLKADLPSGQRVEALEAMRRRALELGRIVDRLLLSSQIEAGRVRVTFSDVDVVGLVTERVASLTAATRREIDLSVGGDVSRARADVEGLVTVVDHLLDNALKYSPAGGPIEVEVAASPGGSDDVVATGVVLHIRDHGIGMDSEQAARCFDKFWQAESTDVRRFGGTGIGLYIVKSLVDAMDGAISVRSQFGTGTTFRVELTAATPDDAASDVDDGDADRRRDAGEASSIREFMRQIGVPEGR